MYKTVKAYVDLCTFCQGFKSRNGLLAGKLCSITPAKHPFSTVGLDHLGHFKAMLNGSQHVIVCIDYLTRWIEVKSLPDTGSKEGI